MRGRGLVSCDLVRGCGLVSGRGLVRKVWSGEGAWSCKEHDLARGRGLVRCGLVRGRGLVRSTIW